MTSGVIVGVRVRVPGGRVLVGVLLTQVPVSVQAAS
jgi:hypothetical protein